MANTKEQQWQALAKRAARVSKALWPTNVRRAIATGRMAQTRRKLISIRLGERGRPQGTLPLPIRLGEPGRPQGAPPLILSTPALTMNVLGVIALVLAGVSIAILMVMRLWLLLLCFSIVILAIFMMLLIVRIRISHTRGLQQGVERKSFPGVFGKAFFPTTPMPIEPPLVRVLDTLDLSETNVEHFLELPEGGNTGGYSLESWKETQSQTSSFS